MLLIHHTYAQSKRANVWCMSEGIVYDFNYNLPLVNSKGSITESSSSSSICDTNGNLQFYTDNETVWNSRHQMLLNGSGLYSCRWSRQGSVIVPLTSNPNQYFLVCCDDLRYPAYANVPYVCSDINPVKYILSLNLIDMSVNNGQGAVLVKNKVIYGSGHVNSMLAAVKHANTKDTWLMTYDFAINRFVSLLLTDCGIQDTVISPDLGVKIEESNSPITFSPNGNFFHVRTDYMLPENGSMIAQFNNATGITSKPHFFRGQNIQACFSIDNHYLYETGGLRYDISLTDTAAIYNSQIVMPISSGGSRSLQNAPDNKIYFICDNPYLNLYILDNPYAINPVLRNQYISTLSDKPGSRPSAAPNFVQSWFDPDFKEYVYGSPSVSYQRGCYTKPVSFTANNIPPATDFHWEIYEKGQPIVRYYNQASITHSFSKAGIHTATLVIDFSCMPDVITRKDIIVDDYPLSDYIKDTAVCPGNNPVLIAQPHQLNYLWNTGNTSSQQKATAGNTYSVEVINTCGSITDSVTLTKLSYTLPNLITPNNDGYNDTFVVDAASTVTGNLEIYNSWGNRIYYNEHYENSWPEHPVEPGIYYYRFTYSTCEPLNSWLQIIE